MALAIGVPVIWGLVEYLLVRVAWLYCRTVGCFYLAFFQRPPKEQTLKGERLITVDYYTYDEFSFRQRTNGLLRRGIRTFVVVVVILVFFSFLGNWVTHFQVVFVKVMQSHVSVLGTTGVIASVRINVDWCVVKR